MSDDTTFLLRQIRQCSLCQQNLPRAANPILQASNHSKILIAGQAPGAVTDEKNIPFDDLSGQRLRHWLGVTREQFYHADNFAILPMGFCFPGKGKNGDLPPLTLCAETWRKQLLNSMHNIELTLILGKYAIEWHLNTKESITVLTKQWQQQILQGYLVLPHPSPRNNRWLAKNTWFEQDVIPQLRLKVQSVLYAEVNV
ncbi:uracil-DNA glycosylase family protein [Thalassotalea marina]|uniref:IclR family transcriptional regulator n=1 Tax=Thalassotalea marina TaxID=1673741 RepID=A0A919BKQ5_9GAMM|nr:uracil-DNA glycosylase family protein [Thalassotalea marina]GHF93670.1 IclR family transcriptional regulator [Thalassotalea marina]